MQGVETLKPKNPLDQLKPSQSRTEDLFKELLNEMKGVEYQITVVTLLSKHKENGEIEYRSVYFNSATKTVNQIKSFIIL